MFQIDNEKFGVFLSSLRKEHQMTQQDLADKLFVSNKTVSKWERGASLPGVSLLLPLAEALDISVSELLRGERTPQANVETDGGISADAVPTETTDATTDTIDADIVLKTIQCRKKYWIWAFLICTGITTVEILALNAFGLAFEKMRGDILLLCGLSLLFTGWFCFFAKELLPGYYDDNKINYVSQGPVRIHMQGLAFNNGNWPYLCTAFKICLMASSILYPLICGICLAAGGIDLWESAKKISAVIIVLTMLAVIYGVGKKYE